MGGGRTSANAFSTSAMPLGLRAPRLTVDAICRCPGRQTAERVLSCEPSLRPAVPEASVLAPSMDLESGVVVPSSCSSSTHRGREKESEIRACHDVEKLSGWGQLHRHLAP